MLTLRGGMRFVKKGVPDKTENSNWRGTLTRRWKDRVEENMHKRGTGNVGNLNKQRGNFWIKSDGDHLYTGSKVSETVDRWKDK